MGIRGRKSGASLSVVSDGSIEAFQRPAPPSELTDEEAREWRQIVEHMAADWFMPGNYPLLAQMCREIVSARRLAELIKHVLDEPEFDEERYLKLCKQQNATSNSIGNLAGRMRLTQRDVMTPHTTKHSKRVKKPWDPD